jgi:thiol-disulfide isomerase/thioredoxin
MNHPFARLILFIVFAMLSFSSIAQQKFPEFSFMDLNDKSFTSKNLKTKLPVIAIFFDPYCSHCEQQAQWIREAESEFQDVQLLFVSTEEKEAIAVFKEKYFNGTTLKHVYFLKDTEYQFDGYFGYSEVPSMYIYNQKWLKVAEFHKETEAEKMIESLKK